MESLLPHISRTEHHRQLGQGLPPARYRRVVADQLGNDPEKGADHAMNEDLGPYAPAIEQLAQIVAMDQLQRLADARKREQFVTILGKRYLKVPKIDGPGFELHRA